MAKRLVRGCPNCGYRQYFRTGTQTWRCDRCGIIEGTLHYRTYQVLQKEPKNIRIWKGYHKKVTPEMKREMARLRATGLVFREIGEKFGVSISTVQYHLNSTTRERTKERQRQAYREGRTWNQRNPEKTREYNRKYMYERYHDDPEFRERIIRHVKKHYDKTHRLQGSAKNG